MKLSSSISHNAEVQNNLRSLVRCWTLAASILAGSAVDTKHSTFRIAFYRSLVLAIFSSREIPRCALTGVTVARAVVAIVNAFTSMKTDMLVVSTHLDNMFTKIPSITSRTDTVFINGGRGADQVIDIGNVVQYPIILAPLGTFSAIFTIQGAVVEIRRLCRVARELAMRTGVITGANAIVDTVIKECLFRHLITRCNVNFTLPNLPISN